MLEVDEEEEEVDVEDEDGTEEDGVEVEEEEEEVVVGAAAEEYAGAAGGAGCLACSGLGVRTSLLSCFRVWVRFLLASARALVSSFGFLAGGGSVAVKGAGVGGALGRVEDGAEDVEDEEEDEEEEEGVEGAE